MMVRKTMRFVMLMGVLVAANCRTPAPPPPPPPPPARQNLIVLLPNEDGTAGSIVVTNAGGSQQLTEANTALKVERADTAPGKPFPARMRRFAGTAVPR